MEAPMDGLYLNYIECLSLSATWPLGWMRTLPLKGVISDGKYMFTYEPAVCESPTYLTGSLSDHPITQREYDRDTKITFFKEITARYILSKGDTAFHTFNGHMFS